MKLLKECLLDIVENEVELSFLSKNLAQINYVGVAILAQDTNFSHHRLSDMGILILFLLKLFDGHYTASLFFLRFKDFTVGALANDLEYPVLVHLC